MRRRLLLASAAIAIAPDAVWPQAVKAKRLGVLLGIPKSDPEAVSRMRALVAGLSDAGWREGQNLRIDYRFAGGDSHRLNQFANELVHLKPDVLFATGTQAAVAIRQVTLSIPTVFAQVPDPVSVGLVTNLGRPEGNMTGITNFEFGIATKWLQMVKESVPTVKTVGMVFDPSNPSWAAYVRALEKSAPASHVELKPIAVNNIAELSQRIASLAEQANTALIMFPSPFMTTNRKAVISLAAQYRLPSVYPYSYCTSEGGLMSYGVDTTKLHHEAATYIAQILRGAKPADLPVQQSNNFELVINLKTAKALGLRIPPSLLALADRVIQ